MHPPITETGPLQPQAPTFARRASAYLLDALIIGMPLCILAGLVAAIAILIPALGKSSEAVPLCLLAGAVFLWVLIPIYMLASAWQATPGMRVMNLILVTKTGARPSLQQTSERTSIAVMVSIFFLLGYLWALVDSQGRTLHDICSGTRVILRPELP